MQVTVDGEEEESKDVHEHPHHDHEHEHHEHDHEHPHHYASPADIQAVIDGLAVSDQVKKDEKRFTP